MPKWLRERENEHGEWSTTDLDRGYRVCNYNGHAHDGVHVHHPIGGKRARVEPIAIASLDDAKRIVRAYADDHDQFDWKSFKELVKSWRSSSKKP